MKPTKKNIKVESTLQGEDVSMKLDPEAARRLMNLLTDQYSNPELAVLREYSTNARDSHIEAGIDKPIEVELPQALRPTLVIRDFGVGLSAEDIRKVYSLYGASTKLHSNDYNGMLGIGSKAALTYTNQFSVKGVKDGVKTIVSVSRDEEGGGTMTILSEQETDEPNGVEVTVPVSTDNNFSKLAQFLFAFWPDGSVLVDGKEPNKIWDKKDSCILSDDFIIYNNYDFYNPYHLEQDTQDFIVQGGVPYPVNFDKEVPIVAWVPNGTVDFVPSREELQYSHHTNESIEKIKTEFDELVKKIIQDKTKEAKTKWEFCASIRQLITDMGWSFSDFSFQGENPPKLMTAKKHEDSSHSSTPGIIIANKASYSRGRYKPYSEQSYTSFLDGHRSVWIRNFNNATFTKQMQEKVRRFFEGKNIEYHHINLVRDSDFSGSDWVNPEHIFEWEEVKKIKLPHQKKKEPQYRAYLKGRRCDISLSELDPQKPVFCLPTQAADELSVQAKKISDMTGMYKNDIQILIVKSTSKNKISREFSTAVFLEEQSTFFEDNFKIWWDCLPEKYQEGLIIKGHHYERKIIEALENHHKIIEDERIRNIFKPISDPPEEVRRFYSKYENYAPLKIKEKSMAISKERISFLSDYPLLEYIIENTSSYFYRQLPKEASKDLANYINNTYKTKVKGVS